MTDHPIKLILLNILLLCCLQGILAGAVLANAITLYQGGAPAGKRKSLHEYGPEDLHPEAQESENSATRKKQTQQPKGKILVPTAPKSLTSPTSPTSPRSIDTSSPALNPRTIPTVTPSPVEPTVTGSSALPVVTPTSAAHQSTAPTVASSSVIQKPKTSGTVRRKLLISSAIFLALFASLIFVAIKMYGQISAAKLNAKDRGSQKQVAGAEKRQLRIVGQGAPEKRVNRSEISTKGVKTKTQNERGARFKKA